MHVDQDSLALLALGEHDADAQAHVRTCEVCRAEVRSLAVVTDVLAGTGALEPMPPPARVWAGIQAAIDAQHGSPTAGDPTVTPTPLRLDARRDRPQQGATTSSTARGRRSDQGRLLAAAAVGAVVALAGSALWGQDEQGPVTVLSSADLAALTESVGPATAQVVERDGARVLRVAAGDLPVVDDGYLEVWLLEPGAAGMVTIGLLESGEQEFVLPEGLSTQQFAVVDVSVEHYDGDPTHSGDSVWRGPLADG